MSIIAFAASSSKGSINKTWVGYAAGLIEGVDVEILDLNDFELPLFSVDKEAQLGQLPLAQAFLSKIASANGLIISFAEHNGTYSAAYKNLFDWCSRIDKNVFCGKPAVFLSASPGARGGATVLAQAVASAARFGGHVVASLSLPNFYENFDVESGSLKNDELKSQLTIVMQLFKSSLAS